MPGIHSQSVILIEGDANEIVPNTQLAAEMHGFVIMVPPGEGGERLLDMVWRITMAYAGKPSMLASRTIVRKMVEAVWSKASREPKPARRPPHVSGSADLTTIARTESLTGSRGGGKAKTKQKN